MIEVCQPACFVIIVCSSLAVNGHGFESVQGIVGVSDFFAVGVGEFGYIACFIVLVGNCKAVGIGL